MISIEDAERLCAIMDRVVFDMRIARGLVQELNASFPEIRWEFTEDEEFECQIGD